MKGYDYDGVITKGLLPGMGDVIITGRSCSMSDVARTYGDMERRKIRDVAVYFMPTVWKGFAGKKGLVKTGEWKALMIDILELDEFFEDDLTQHKAIVDHLKGTCKITRV